MMYIHGRVQTEEFFFNRLKRLYLFVGVYAMRYIHRDPHCSGFNLEDVLSDSCLCKIHTDRSK